MADELWSTAVEDPAHTLGGIKNDIDPEHPNVVMHLVKSLMPGQDLTRVTIPSFFLEPRSLLERMADMLMHPDLLLNVSQQPDPVERMKAITKWFLSGWHYKTVGVKKPFNPIVGETFACYWQHEDGSRSQYLAEQVLHRPPISAIYFENRQHHVEATGHVWTKSQFSAPQTTKSILDGAVILSLTNLGEEYYITFPTYYAHNLLIGSLRMEVGDTCYIACVKTGLRADIDFLQKPMFGGSDRINGVDARIRRVAPADGPAPTADSGSSSPFHPKNQGEELCRITGNWDKQLRIAAGGAAAELFLDVENLPVLPKRVLPLSAQGPWESRRLWQHASLELSKRPKVEWELVDREKAQLEEEQRLVPCHFKQGSADYKEWATKRFHPRKQVDPIKGEEKELYVFDGVAKGRLPKDEAAAFASGELNLLAVSRALPDPRGGLGGAGAEESMVTAMRSVALSEKRKGTREQF